MHPGLGPEGYPSDHHILAIAAVPHPYLLRSADKTWVRAIIPLGPLH